MQHSDNLDDLTCNHNNNTIPRTPSSIIAGRIAAALMSEPMNMKTLAATFGIDPKHAGNFNKYIDGFKAVGVIYVHHYTNVNSPWYMWQPDEPFGVPDAPRPEKRMGSDKVINPRLLYSYEGEMLTLSEIAKKVGLNKRTLYSRIRLKGLDLEEALFPARRYIKLEEDGYSNEKQRDSVV